MGLLVQQIIKCKYELGSHVSDPARALIRGLLCTDPAGAPSAAGLPLISAECRSLPPRAAEGRCLALRVRRLGTECEGLSLIAKAWHLLRWHVPRAARLGAGGIASVQEARFYDGLDWDMLLDNELAAPLTPTSFGKDKAGGENYEPSATAQSKHGEGIERIQREFTAWDRVSAGTPSRMARSPRASKEYSRESRESDVTSHGSSSPASAQDDATWLVAKRRSAEQSVTWSAQSLALELTQDGCIWAVSPPLLRLLGLPRSAQHLLLGRSLLDPHTTLLHPVSDHDPPLPPSPPPCGGARPMPSSLPPSGLASRLLAGRPPAPPECLQQGA